jgi:hypothetical protein
MHVSCLDVETITRAQTTVRRPATTIQEVMSSELFKKDPAVPNAIGSPIPLLIPIEPAVGCFA